MSTAPAALLAHCWPGVVLAMHSVLPRLVLHLQYFTRVLHMFCCLQVFYDLLCTTSTTSSGSSSLQDSSEVLAPTSGTWMEVVVKEVGTPHGCCPRPLCQTALHSSILLC
jgi:hypothetical protein